MAMKENTKSEALRRQREVPLLKVNLEPPAVKISLSKTYDEYKSTYELWHPRLAHINPRLAKLAKPELEGWPEKAHCDGCVLGKIHRFPHSGKRPAPADMPWLSGEYFTCDLFGPLLQSKGGAHYAAFYTDLKSKFTYYKCLRTKTEHYQAFLQIIVDAKARRPMYAFLQNGWGWHFHWRGSSSYLRQLCHQTYAECAWRFRQQRCRGTYHTNIRRAHSREFVTCECTAMFLGGSHEHGRIRLETPAL